MAKIFISHSSQDDDFVAQLAADLSLIRHMPWTDDMEIRPGDSIIRRIEQGLLDSRHMIVVLSQAALKSGWVETEWKEKLWDAVTDQKIMIIPVLKEQCQVPAFLRGLRYADFSKSYAVGFYMLSMTLKHGTLIPQVPDEFLKMDILRAIEQAAKTHHENQIRIACAHTIWSCRPDRAKPILEDALNDWAQEVRDHARALLDNFY